MTSANKQTKNKQY